MVARDGICGMEVVDTVPEYDHHDVSAQLGARDHGRARHARRGGPCRSAKPSREQGRFDLNAPENFDTTPEVLAIEMLQGRMRRRAA